MTITFDTSMMSAAERRQVRKNEQLFERTGGEQVMDGKDTLKDTPSCKVSKVAQASEASAKSDVGNRLLAMYRRYIGATEDDLIIAVLWTLHTWVYMFLYTTPRLLVTSILPGAGKTTLLDWIRHFGRHVTNENGQVQPPASMAVASSASMLASLAEQGCVMLVDEADRSLRRDNPLTADLLAVVNSGYRKGSTRPVQTPTKEGGWQVVSKSTFAPVAFAGNNPDLPEDTEQRCIRLFLFPDDNVEDSDWELIEESDEYKRLFADIARWATAESTLARLKDRPDLGPDVRGRFKEIWLPLARTAQTLAPFNDGKDDWLEHVRTLAQAFVAQVRIDQEEGMRRTSPHAALLADIACIWSTEWRDRTFVASKDLCERLAAYDPGAWGKGNVNYATAITPRRLADMLRKTGVVVGRGPGNKKRGYHIWSFAHTWRTLSVPKALRDANRINDEQREWLDALDGSDTLDTLHEGVSGKASTPGTLDASDACATLDTLCEGVPGKASTMPDDYEPDF